MHHQISRPGIGIYPAQNYVLVKGLPWGGSEDSFFHGASPAVANGDMAAVSPLTAPDSFTWTLSATGVPTIYSGGSVARQSITLDVYDLSTRQWMGLVTDYVNDQAPTATGGPQSFSYAVGDDVAIDLNDYFIDTEGDQLAYSLYSGTLPDGLMFSGSLLTGTALSTYSGDVVFTATDISGQAGQSEIFSLEVTSGMVTWPDLTGLTVPEAQGVLTALGLLLGTTTVGQSTETEGTIISQIPLAGADASAGDSVDVILAQGNLAHHRGGRRGTLTLPVIPQLTPEQQAVLTAREAAHKLFNRIPTMQGPVLSPIEAKVDALAKKMLS